MSTTDPQVQHPPEAPAGAPSIPSDYEELKSFRENMAARLGPYWDDYIQPILENEEEREFIKTARESRKRYLESQEPTIEPGLARVRDEFRAEFAPVVEWAMSEKQAREQEKAEREAREKAEEEASQAANRAYAQRLVTERPDLAEENYAGMHMIAALSQRDNISLEESWKRYGARLGGSRPKRETPPPSLRGGEARPGVPGESTEPPIRSARDLSRRLANNLRNGGRG